MHTTTSVPQGNIPSPCDDVDPVTGVHRPPRIRPDAPPPTSLHVVYATGKRRIRKAAQLMPDGRISVGVDKTETPKWLTHTEVPLGGPADLFGVLAWLETEPTGAVVRGCMRPEVADAAKIRLIGSPRDGDPVFLRDCPRHVVEVDLDHVPRASIPPEIDPRWQLEDLGVWMRDTYLPPPFHGASCWAQVSSSTLLLNPDEIGIHLWFWAENPVSSKQLKAYMEEQWVAGYRHIDTGIYTPYCRLLTSVPRVDPPLVDPYPDGRSVVLPGRPMVELDLGQVESSRPTHGWGGGRSDDEARDLPALTDDELHAIAPTTSTDMGLLAADEAILELGAAPDGLRHDIARDCARRMGYRVADGDLSIADAWSAFMRGAHACALDQDLDENLPETFRAGLGFGVGVALARRQRGAATTQPESPPEAESPPPPSTQADTAPESTPPPAAPEEVSPEEWKKLGYDADARATAQTWAVPSPGAPPAVELLPRTITIAAGDPAWLDSVLIDAWRVANGQVLVLTPPSGSSTIHARRLLDVQDRRTAELHEGQGGVVSVRGVLDIPAEYTPRVLAVYSSEDVYAALCGDGLPRRTGSRPTAPEAWVATMGLAERVLAAGGSVLLLDPHAGARTEHWAALFAKRGITPAASREITLRLARCRDSERDAVYDACVRELGYPVVQLGWQRAWSPSPASNYRTVEDTLDATVSMVRGESWAVGDPTTVVFAPTKQLRALQAALSGLPGVRSYDPTPCGEDIQELRDPERWGHTSCVRVALVSLRVAGEMVPGTAPVRRVVLIADRSPGRSWQSLMDPVLTAGPAQEYHVYISPGRWNPRSPHPYAIHCQQNERRQLTQRGVEMSGAPMPPPLLPRWGGIEYAEAVRVETRCYRLDRRIPGDCVLTHLAARGAQLVPVEVPRASDDARAAPRRWKLLMRSARARRAQRIAAAPVRNQTTWERREPPRTREDVDSREHTRLVDLYGTDPGYTSRAREVLDDGTDGERLTGMEALAHDDESGSVTRKAYGLATLAHVMSGDLRGAARDDRRALGTGASCLGDATTVMAVADKIILSDVAAVGPEWGAWLGRPPAVSLSLDGRIRWLEADTPALPPPEWHSHHPLDDPRKRVQAHITARLKTDAPVRAWMNRPWAWWVGQALGRRGYRTTGTGPGGKAQQRRMTQYDTQGQPLPGPGKRVEVRTLDLEHAIEWRRLSVVVVARSFGAVVRPLIGGADATAWTRAVDPETGMWRRVAPEEDAWPGESAAVVTPAAPVGGTLAEVVAGIVTMAEVAAA